MDSFDVLAAETEILGAHVLEASAGTGKTFAIEHLVVRLLLQEEVEMTLDKMLVVTFTRAATRELKARIRNNLHQALEGLQTSGGAAYLAPYYGKERALRKIQKALSAFEESAIFTIHGFCHRMLKAFAFEAGVGLNTRDPDDKGYQSLMRVHVRDFFRTGLREGLYSSEHLEVVLKKFKQDVTHLENALIRLMEGGALGEIGEGSDPLTPSHILLKMAGQCQLKWEKMERRDQISPDEILKQMGESLNSDSFATLVATKYRAVIIDEFQDTDPLQWEIFERLFIEVSKPAAFYLVGDPKQSIYAFRNADIYTYLEAAAKVGSRAFLDTNYRSLPSLVRSLNYFFGSAPWMALPKKGESISFHPVKTHGEDSGGRLHFFIAEGVPTREKKWPSTSLEEDILFPYMATECENYPNKTIAVLVKDRYQAERLHLFFQKWGFSSVIKQGFDLKESTEFQALYRILCAVQRPRDLSLLKGALGTPFMRWTASDFLEEEKIQNAKRLFLEYKTLWEERGFPFFVQKWLKDGAVTMTSPLRQLLELLMSSPSDPLFLLKELSQSEERIDRRVEEKPGDIVIMTTHMSKGLEFDVVFALGLASRHLVPEEFIRNNGRLFPSDADPAASHLAEREQEAEKLRALYVAMTRGKEALYVPIVLDPQNKSSSPSPLELFLEKALGAPPTRDNLFPFIDKFATYTFLAGKITPPFHISLPPLSLEPLEPPKNYPSEVIVSFSTLANPLTHFSPTPVDTVIPLGSETGTLVHSLLEKVLVSNYHFPFQEEKCLKVIEKGIKGTSLEGLSQPLLEMVMRAMHTPLDGFSLCEIPASQLMVEMEFLYPLNGNIVKGFADLCMVWKGKYYFLDWKTNSIADYLEPTLVKTMEQHDYFLQASLYAEALHRYVKLFDTDLEFGGAFYYFLRGHAVYHFFPENRQTKGVL